MINNYKATDEFWTHQDASAGLTAINGDSLHFISGCYDIFVNHTIGMYQEKRRQGYNPYLTVGNGDHGASGALVMPMAFKWLKYRLKGDASGIRKSPVAAQLNTGAWSFFDEWPPKSTELKYYLSKAEAEGTFAGELISEPSSRADVFSYDYNPENPTPNFVGPCLFLGGAKDNMPFLLKRQNMDEDVVVYTSSQLDDRVIIAGNVEVVLHVSSSLEHADFYARLLDYDCGKNVSLNVCEGLVRISPANQPPKTEDGSFVVQITLTPTFYSFAQGHQVMLQVASGAHPRYTRNPGTGEHISTATKFLRAEQKIFTSPVHLSYVSLPQLLDVVLVSENDI